MSVPRYQRYKDSGVEWLGEVPDHWEVRKLRDLARLESGHTPSRQRPDYWIEADCVIPWFTLADVSFLRDDRNFVIDSTSQKISQVGMENSAARLLPPGTVLLSRTASVGFSGITNIALAVSQDFAAWICSPRIQPRYLLHCLRAMRPEFQRLMMGSTHQTIYMPDIVAFRVPIPPQSEQARIIAFLDSETTRLDELIAEQQRLMNLLREKRQSIISHAVTKGLNPNTPMKPSGVEWLGDVPVHWDVRRLSPLSTKITNGYVGPTRDILTDDGVRYLQSLHIKGNEIRFEVPYFVSEEWSNQHSKSILKAGDVLIVQTGDIGQATVVTDEFAGCNCHALIIVSPVRSIVDGEWISWVLNSDYGLHSLLSIQTGALHPHLNCGDVKDITIPLPPIVEQRSIVADIARQILYLEDLATEAQSAIDLLQERRTALIAAAVTGQIDVRGLVEAEAA